MIKPNNTVDTDRQTDRQTDRLTDIKRCATHVIFFFNASGAARFYLSFGGNFYSKWRFHFSNCLRGNYIKQKEKLQSGR